VVLLKLIGLYWIIEKFSRDTLKRYSSIGLNPIYKPIKEIEDVLNSTFKMELEFNDISKVIFYGAGCMAYENSEKVKVAPLIIGH